MARQRMLHPGFFTDSKLLRLPPLHRLLYEGLWVLADREGRLKDEPDDIKLLVLPADDCDVDAMLSDLAHAGRVVRYEAEGLRCIAVPRFLEYQHPHKNEKPSTLPPPPGMARHESGLGPTHVGAAREMVVAARAESVTKSVTKSVTESVETQAPAAQAPPALEQPPAREDLRPPPDAADSSSGTSAMDPGEASPLPTPRGLLQLEPAEAQKPAHAALVAVLAAVFLEERGTRYRWQRAKDGAALSGLLRDGAAPDDVVARWRAALTSRDKWLRCSTVAQLASKWNDLADATASSRAARPTATGPPAACEVCGYSEGYIVRVFGGHQLCVPHREEWNADDTAPTAASTAEWIRRQQHALKGAAWAPKTTTPSVSATR